MRQANLKRDARYIRAFIMFWCIATLIVFSYTLVSPIANLVYIYQRSDGTSVDNTYGLGWWPVTLFIVLNYLLIAIMYSVVTDPDSPARVDLHQIATFAAMVGNALLFVVFLVYYLAYINTSFAGGLPYNDYRWCCVYHLDEPSYCPNTIDCPITPALTGGDLRVNNDFRILWIFTVVFFSFATAHRVFNLLLRRTGAVVPPKSKSYEGEILAYLITGSNLGLFVYWVGWPLLDTIHLHGYPTLGIPPGPGEFISTRYNWPWIALGILCLNIIPPLFFMASLTIRNTQFVHITHFWFTVIINIISAVVLFFLIWLLIPLVGYCNFFNSAGSICNDYRWCCNHFADAPDYCSNVTPCDAGVLLPNAEFVRHIILALVFTIYNGVSIWLNYRMKSYGIFLDAVAEEEEE